MSFLTWLTDAGAGFTPHGYCLLWEPGLIAETLIGNLMIWLAYMIIPLELYLLLRVVGDRRLVISSGTLINILFAAFIFCCGMSHAMDIVVMFYPIYWLQAHWLVLTGVISLMTCAITGWVMRLDLR